MKFQSALSGSTFWDRRTLKLSTMYTCCTCGRRIANFVQRMRHPTIELRWKYIILNFWTSTFFYSRFEIFPSQVRDISNLLLCSIEMRMRNKKNQFALLLQITIRIWANVRWKHTLMMNNPSGIQECFFITDSVRFSRSNDCQWSHLQIKNYKNYLFPCRFFSCSWIPAQLTLTLIYLKYVRIYTDIIIVLVAVIGHFMFVSMWIEQR